MVQEAESLQKYILLIFFIIAIVAAIIKLMWPVIWNIATAEKRKQKKQESDKALGDLRQYYINNLNKQYDDIVKKTEYKKGSTQTFTTELFSLYYGDMDRSKKYSQKFDLWKNEHFFCCVSNKDFLTGEICKYERVFCSGDDEKFNKIELFKFALEKYDINHIHAFCIPLDHIEYFAKDGEKYTTQEISGGGGTVGGYSLTGAVVGGVIAGGAGAIIGSRKKGEIAPITTKTTMHDETFCFIKYRTNDNQLCEVYSSDTEVFYEALKRVIPEKEYSYVISKSQVQAPAGASQKSSEERLLNLKKLLDQGLITEEEYTKKRNTILEEI